MCQLFGMSSKQPASVQISLEGFVRRGGETGDHIDGWGIAFFHEAGCDIFADEQPSVRSVLARQIQDRPIKSRQVIAHVRKATRGSVAQANCHPFRRRLWNKDWVFAHNGHLEHFHPGLDGEFNARGETDSEQAFCLLLQQLRQRFGTTPPSLERLRLALHGMANNIAAHGAFNFLLSDGEHLFAYCSTSLAAVERHPPFGQVRLVDCDRTFDLSHYNQPDDRMVLLATEPLTGNEHWSAFAPGELRVYAGGRELATLARQVAA